MTNIQRSGTSDFIRKSFAKTLGVMGVLLFFLGVGYISAENAYSQNTRLSLELKNTTMKAVFHEIEKSSEYIFFYSDEINVNKKVAVSVKNQTIDAIMNQVLQNTGYVYVVSDRQVFIKKQAIAEVVTEKWVVEQGRTINGVVVGKAGESIIGANVMLKGTTTGTITDFDGKFSLTVPTGNAVLVVSYVGYAKQEVTVTGGNAPLNIVLVEDSEMMSEVVVIGYGVQKKINMTGAISTVRSEELTGRTNPNLLQSIQGVVPGATVISRPGQTPSINIRGHGNLQMSEPLYVIDGAISSSIAFANLDPNSIESISILKDAASSSIYGSRAAYGVMLVTTKQGRKEGLSVNYDGYVSMKQTTCKPKVVSSEWEAILINESVKNSGQTTIPVPDDIIQKYRDGSEPDLYPNTNWYDLIFDDNALTTSHTISFNGTTGKTGYYASLGYTYDDSFQPGQSTNRYNFNLNLTSQLKPWLRLRASVKYIESALDKSTGDIIIAYLMQSSPSYVARQSNGEYGTVHGGANASGTFVARNPLRELEQSGWTKRNMKTTTFDGAIDLTLYKGLVLTGQLISDNFDYKNKKYKAFMTGVPRFLDHGATTVAEVKQSDSKLEYDWYDNRHITYNALLNYEWSNYSHAVNVLLGSSYESYNYQGQRSYRKNFPTNTIEGLDGGSTSPTDSHAEGSLTEEKLISYFGRVNYNYKEKYLVEANFRADATSRFHEDKRWGYFPSFSAGWRISEEGFMKDLTWVNNLKVRGSWGQLGSIHNVNQYDYFAAYAVESYFSYSIGNIPISSIYESRIPNKSLTWETVTMTNMGLDANLFDNKLVFSTDWYLKKTDDILLGYDVLREVGAASEVSQNLGKVENKGVEFVLTHSNTIGDVFYAVSANLSKNWNKISYLGENVKNLAPNGAWIMAVGQPSGTFYGYKTDGLLTAEDIAGGNYITNGTELKPGDVKYVDMDNSGDLNTADRTFLGKDAPDITYGGSINVSYKNFDLNIFGQGISGAKVYFRMENAHPFSDNAPPREWHKKRWTEENPDPKAAYPRLLPQGNNNYMFNTQDYSDFWLFSADYFRIKNITLGYTFAEKLLKPIGLTKLRLYVSSENPFTIRGDKRMEDFDPETYTGRGSLVTGTRSYIFGVNVAF